jgi:hypothetical protein
MKRHNNARLLFPAISSAVTAVILLIAFRWLTGPLQYALLMGAGISAVAFVPAAVAVTQDVVHPVCHPFILNHIHYGPPEALLKPGRVLFHIRNRYVYAVMRQQRWMVLRLWA